MRGLVLLAALAGACEPRLDDAPELVSAARIIAVQAEPAEVVPGAPLTLRGFVATPDGPAEPALEWAFCSRPKPLGENGVVDPACVTDDLPAAGPPGISVDTVMPASACQLFGPEIPPQTAGEPPARPRDPDATGGYYQPVRVKLGDSVAFALVRVRCRLAMAPFSVAQDFEHRYQNDQNPAIEELGADAAGGLTATWPAAAAETFVRFDLERQRSVDEVEVLRPTWFATRRLGSPMTSADGSQVAVSEPAPGSVVHVWLVLRDDRGGVDVRVLDWTAP